MQSHFSCVVAYFLDGVRQLLPPVPSPSQMSKLKELMRELMGGLQQMEKRMEGVRASKQKVCDVIPACLYTIALAVMR